MLSASAEPVSGQVTTLSGKIEILQQSGWRWELSPPLAVYEVTYEMHVVVYRDAYDGDIIIRQLVHEKRK